MIKEIRFIPLAILVLFTLATSILASSDAPARRHIVVEGMSYLAGLTVNEARSLAIEDAERKAIEKGASVYVRSRSEIDEFANLIETFYSEAAAFVGNRNVLREGVVGDKYLYKMECDVSLEPILDSLSNYGVLDNHTVMLFIDENVAGTPFSAATLETELMAQLIDNFNVIDRSQMDAVAAKNAVDQILAGNVDAAIKLANQYGADTFIVGSAQAQLNTDRNTGMDLGGFFGTYDAVVQLKVVNAATAKVIHAKNYNATGKPANSETMAANKAMTSVGEIIGRDINVEVPKGWGRAIDEGADYRVVISGASFGTKDALIKFLEDNTTGFIKVTGAQFTGGVWTFTLVSMDSIETIAGLLDGKRIGGERYSVSGMTSASIDLKVS